MMFVKRTEMLNPIQTHVTRTNSIIFYLVGITKLFAVIKFFENLFKKRILKIEFLK